MSQRAMPEGVMPEGVMPERVMPEPEQGTALVTSLLVIVCLSALGLGLLAASSAERQIAGYTKGAAAVSAAADAAIDAVCPRSAPLLIGSALLASGVSTFHDVTHQPTSASRTVLDLDAVTATAEESATLHSAPTLRAGDCLRGGSLARIAGIADTDSGVYVGVWLADDVGDADGVPEADANGIIRVHSEAFGFGRPPTRRRRGDCALGVWRACAVMEESLTMAWTYPAAILLIIAALRGGTGGTLADAAFYESIRRAIGPKAERSLTMADVPAP